MSEEIHGVIGGQDDKGESVVIVISGKIPKAKAEKLKAELERVVKDSGLTVRMRKASAK